ncbi:MAG: glycosyltransferase [Ignavibacteria bacterium]|jgi:glycosyltransferase involved in cell wall biosynthesis|nr:glycosyltransferase [Ignavibacteria bacterium]
MQKHKYSFVIPVYNRPDEVTELLDSIAELHSTDEEIDFEVVIVEDGSTVPCKDVADRYADKVAIQYFMKEKAGPSAAREYGVANASGDYIIFTDSDCILEPNYLVEVNKAVLAENLDVYGGPDNAHRTFSNMQKATNYAMTSFFTTGGIRNKKKSLGGKYYPRSFNLGLRKELFQQIGGFPPIHPGEDIEFTIKLFELNCKVGFIPNAIVFHKRRTSFAKFFRQVYKFGCARIYLNRKFPETKKLVYYLPAAFTAFTALFLLSTIVCKWAITPLLLYALLVLIDATLRNRSIVIGAMSIIASFIQLLGYGSGFIKESICTIILGKEPSINV